MHVKVVAVSKISKHIIFKWIQEVETLSLRELEIPQARWDHLDTALADAVSNVATGPLKRDLFLYQESRSRRGHALSGRGAFWYV